MALSTGSIYSDMSVHKFSVMTFIKKIWTKTIYSYIHTCPTESALSRVTWHIHLVTDVTGLPSTDCNNCMLITKGNLNNGVSKEILHYICWFVVHQLILD
jgi:hypothetical protein